MRKFSSVTACNELRIDVYFRSEHILHLQNFIYFSSLYFTDKWMNEWCDLREIFFPFNSFTFGNESLMLSSKSSKASSFKHDDGRERDIYIWTSTLGINYFWQIYFKLKSHSLPFHYKIQPLKTTCDASLYIYEYFKK